MLFSHRASNKHGRIKIYRHRHSDSTEQAARETRSQKIKYKKSRRRETTEELLETMEDGGGCRAPFLPPGPPSVAENHLSGPHSEPTILTLQRKHQI